MPPIDLSAENWREVCEILQTHARNYSVLAFGSRVKGNAKTYSDLDLAIVTQKPLSLSEIALLTEAFEESNLPIRVDDIVDWASTNKAFQEIIRQQKVVIQEGQHDEVICN